MCWTQKKVPHRNNKCFDCPSCVKWRSTPKLGLSLAKEQGSNGPVGCWGRFLRSRLDIGVATKANSLGAVVWQTLCVRLEQRDGNGPGNCAAPSEGVYLCGWCGMHVIGPLCTSRLHRAPITFRKGVRPGPMVWLARAHRMRGCIPHQSQFALHPSYLAHVCIPQVWHARLHIEMNGLNVIGPVPHPSQRKKASPPSPAIGVCGWVV